MRNHRLALGTIIFFLVTSGAYANNPQNQVYLTNSSSNHLSYSVVANPGAGSSQLMGQFVPPNNGPVEEFVITTNGLCFGDVKTTTYPIEVVGEHRIVLCRFNFVVTIANEGSYSANPKTGMVSGCDTTNSTIGNAKITDMQQYGNGTSDYCSVSWQGQNETQPMYYQSGILNIKVSSK